MIFTKDSNLMMYFPSFLSRSNYSCLSNAVQKPPVGITRRRDTVGQKQKPVVIFMWCQAIGAPDSFIIVWVKATVFPIEESGHNTAIAIHPYCDIVGPKVPMREDNLGG